MTMRSAIHYPDTHLKSKRSMASALLLWDNLRAITPWDGFPITYHAREMAEAWELIGRPLVPDDVNKREAHQSIEKMIAAGVPRRIQYSWDLRPDQEYQMCSQKLSHQTWNLLTRNRLAGSQLSTGDFPLEEKAGMVIMAKLADACGGNVFARVTDRMLAYDLIADRDEPLLAHSHVVPMTLELIDASSITLERLIDFRSREARERRGGDFTTWRHQYADVIQQHIITLRNVKSANQRDELNSQFREEMGRHLAELRRAIGLAKAEMLLKPVVISTVVAVGGFLAAGPLGGLAGLAAGPTLKGLSDMFSAGIGFSEKQRKAMDKNPMAYMYQLSRA